MTRIVNTPKTGDAIDATQLMKRGSLGVFVLRILSLGLVFAAEVLMARFLGIENYDIYASGISWLVVLAAVVGLGMNNAILRHLPADQAHHRFGLMRGMIQWTAWRMVSAGGIVGAALAGAALLGLFGDPILEQVLLIVALMLPVLALNTHRQAVLQGLKRPVLGLLPEQTVRPLAISLLVVTAYYCGFTRTAAYGAGIYMAALFLAFAVGTWLLSKNTPHEVRNAPPNRTPLDWWATAGPMLWIALCGVLINQADPAMLRLLANPGEAALFASANRISMLLAFGLIAVNAIAAPLISQLHSTGQQGNLQKILRLAALCIAVFTIPAGLFVFLYGPWLLSFFGNGFAPAQDCLIVLTVGQMVNAFAGSVGFLLLMTGHQMVAARILTITAAGKLVLNFILMPQYGAMGAAIGSAAAIVLLNGWLWLEVRHRLRLEPTLLALFRSP